MMKFANLGLAAVTAGMLLAPGATTSAQGFDRSALQPAQYYHYYYDRDRDRDWDRDRDRNHFRFGIYVTPRSDYDDYGYYCTSHWRWSPWANRWVLVRECD